MPKVLVYSSNNDDENNLLKPLKDVGYLTHYINDFDMLYKEVEVFIPDIVILSLPSETDDVSRICRKIRLLNQTSDVQIILMVAKADDFNDISQGADGYIQYPVNPAILISMVNSHLRIKNHLDIFSANNSELAKRFYQLKVLYDTSSNLAGTLNRRKLINIMNEGLEQSISFSLCSTLIINNPNDILLLINSACPLTKRLEQALKLRAIITYKSMFNDADLPLEFTVDEIKTEINCKQEDGVYDLEVMSFSSIFSPLSTQDKFFGTVEIMRDSDLSTEDTACFQTVVSQVALPLESAILYEEIQNKNDKLTKLERVKSEFISIVSHELRTPLTSINNALYIMLSGKTGEVSESMAKFLNMGKKNVERLSEMINALLDMSKIEAGKMEYRFEKMNLIEAINSSFSTCNATAIKNKIELATDITIDNADVYGDTQKLEQVVTNLVGNALKFTNENGKVKIVLSEDKNKDNWLVEIKDTGIGISKDNIAKVFDKFQQIESSLSRKVGGTGLGLPIAKEFILAHNGNIWVESEENVGTSFFFSLPKYNRQTSFVIELERFFEKSQASKTNFGVLACNSKFTDEIKDYIKKDSKCRQLMSLDDLFVFIVTTHDKNIFEMCVEKLKNFVCNENNGTISLNTAYCDWNEIQTFQDLVQELGIEK